MTPRKYIENKYTKSIIEYMENTPIFTRKDLIKDLGLKTSRNINRMFGSDVIEQYIGVYSKNDISSDDPKLLEVIENYKKSKIENIKIGLSNLKESKLKINEIKESIKDYINKNIIIDYDKFQSFIDKNDDINSVIKEFKRKDIIEQIDEKLWIKKGENPFKTSNLLKIDLNKHNQMYSDIKNFLNIRLILEKDSIKLTWNLFRNEKYNKEPRIYINMKDISSIWCKPIKGNVKWYSETKKLSSLSPAAANYLAHKILPNMPNNMKDLISLYNNNKLPGLLTLENFLTKSDINNLDNKLVKEKSFNLSNCQIDEPLDELSDKPSDNISDDLDNYKIVDDNEEISEEAFQIDSEGCITDIPNDENEFIIINITDDENEHVTIDVSSEVSKFISEDISENQSENINEYISKDDTVYTAENISSAVSDIPDEVLNKISYKMPNHDNKSPENDYEHKLDRNIILMVDNRKNDVLVAMLSRVENLTIKKTKLDNISFIAIDPENEENQLMIDRKDCHKIVKELIDDRLKNQVIALTKYNKEKYFIVEGGMLNFSMNKDENVRYISTIQAKLNAKYNIKLLESHNVLHSFNLIMELIKEYFINNKKIENINHPKNKNLEKDINQSLPYKMLQLIDGVDYEIANALLKKFKTIENIAKADAFAFASLKIDIDTAKNIKNSLCNHNQILKTYTIEKKIVYKVKSTDKANALKSIHDENKIDETIEIIEIID